jgi:ribosomal protein S20
VLTHQQTDRGQNTLAHSSRGWTGARTPQALKRVRQSTRRNDVLAPRRSEAKTEVKDALQAAASGDVELTRTAVAEAASALDRAAKVGAIHPNNAARRKSRLMRRANAALGGEALVGTAKPQRQVSKSAAAKAAKTRIAAGKASKAKGEQTAAGKARAALSKSSRSAEAAASAVAAGKTATVKASTSKSATTKAATKSTPKTSTSKASTSKATTSKASTSKATTSKAASKSSTTKATPKSASKSTKDAS